MCVAPLFYSECPMPNARCSFLTTAAALALAAITSPAFAQLRVVSYNTLDKPLTAADDALFNTIMSAIETTARNGVAKRVDIFSLQEQSRQLDAGQIVDTTENIAALMNSLYGTSSYQAAIVSGGVDRVGVVYDTSAVTLLSEEAISTTGNRDSHLSRFRPVGYSSPDAELYLYGVHFDAGSASVRSNESTALANHANGIINTLQGSSTAANVIFAGDFNFKSSGEAGYSTLSAGPANDPIALPSWPNSGVAEHLTQSTRSTNLPDGGVPGGLDDRFDLQLNSDDLLDGEGVSYIGPTSAGFTGAEHSYHAFGNDGNTFNQAINATFANRSQSAAVINALHDFSDHLPVVADYQLPAVLDAVADTIPLTLDVGEVFNLDVTVSNAADVLAAIGADELDYTISTTTSDLSLIGSASGTDLALGGGNVHSIQFDTSTPGIKSGTIEVSTSSLAAENTLIQIPVSYEVIAAVPDTILGDFNGDGVVNGADYARLRNTFGTSAEIALAPGSRLPDNFDPNVNLLDGQTWLITFGSSSLPSAIGSVPEPHTAWFLCLSFCTLMTARRS